jgi:hypothetical protein
MRFVGYFVSYYYIEKEQFYLIIKKGVTKATPLIFENYKPL